MKHALPLFLTSLLLLHAACHNSTEIAGGPCSYEADCYPAVVSSIDTLGVDSIDITCFWYSEESTDTLIYSMINSRYISEAEAREKTLNIGDTLCYQHRRLVEGSCNPDIFSLTLEPWEKPIEDNSDSLE